MTKYDIISVSDDSKTVQDKNGDALRISEFTVQTAVPKSSATKGEQAPRVTNTYGLNFEPGNVYAMMLSEAARVLSETELCGAVSPKVTVFMTESGMSYCAKNCDKPSGVSFDERRVLHSLERSGDSVVTRIVTLWLDGVVVNSSMELYKAVLAINEKNRFSEVLMAKSPRIIYTGNFLPSDYKIQYLRDFLIE